MQQFRSRPFRGDSCQHRFRPDQQISRKFQGLGHERVQQLVCNSRISSRCLILSVGERGLSQPYPQGTGV